jgi:hypothetical protein
LALHAGKRARQRLGYRPRSRISSIALPLALDRRNSARFLMLLGGHIPHIPVVNETPQVSLG